MSQELVISSNPIETTVSVLEDDRLVEIYVEHNAQKSVVGSIYKGRVTRVLPGMQSAFVNIGLKRDAFLYVTDVLDPAESSAGAVDTDPIAAGPPKAVRAATKEAAPEEATDGAAGAAPAQAESGAAEASAPGQSPPKRKRRRRRRRRRKRKAASGAPAEGGDAAEPKPAPKQAEAAEDTPAEDAPAPEAEDAGPVLLPGESLAKYKGAAGKNGKPRSEPTAEAEDATPAAGEDAGAEEKAEAKARKPRRRRRSRGRVKGKRGQPQGAASPAKVAAEAEQLPAGDQPPGDEPPQPAHELTDALVPEPPSPPPEDEIPQPARESATVEAPPAAAEFRLLKWLRGKPAKGEGEKPAPEAKPARRGGASPPKAKTRSKPAQARKPKPRKPKARKPPEQAKKGRRGSRPSAARRKGKAQSKPRGKQSRGRNRERGAAKQAKQANINDLLKPGQELIVQVNKEPVGKKGARITAHVSLPGRYMVYMTTAKHNGVSRRIQPEKERSRLRKLVKKHTNGRPGGFVVRSAGSGVKEERLVADMTFLNGLWQSIVDKAEKRRAPARLHSDLDVMERVLREHLGEDYKAIWVDSEDTYERAAQFVERFQPQLVKRVKLYTRRRPIHDSFGISKDLERALKPKVWLKSGGYLVINQTEALVAIDVNTGRYVGKSNRLEDTVLKTNLEAADEIVRQLRLRDLGGIVVIDFIDMEDRKNRQRVQQVLQEALRKTKSPSRLLPFNDFGMVVITRKAVRQSLERALCMPCPACSGAGKVKSSSTVLSEIFSAAGRMAAKKGKNGASRSKELTLRVHPQVAKSLKRKSHSHLEELEQTAGTNVLVRGDSSMHPEKFTLT